MSVIETATQVLRDEAAAVLSLVDKLDGQFEEAVSALHILADGYDTHRGD